MKKGGSDECKIEELKEGKKKKRGRKCEVESFMLEQSKEEVT